MHNNFTISFKLWIIFKVLRFVNLNKNNMLFVSCQNNLNYNKKYVKKIPSILNFNLYYLKVFFYFKYNVK